MKWGDNMKYVLHIDNFYLPYVFDNRDSAIIQIYKINKELYDIFKKEYFKEKQTLSLKRYKKEKYKKIKIKEI